MPFVLSSSTSYRWPIKYRMPKDGGRYEKQEFDAEFRRLDQSRIDEIHDKTIKGEITDAMIVDEVLIGWSGIRTTDNQDFEHSDANRKILLNLPGMRACIVQEYFDSIGGIIRKN